MAVRPKPTTLPLEFAEAPGLMCLIAGDDWHFEAVSPAWTELTGWSEAQLVGKSFIDFIHVDDRVRSRLHGGTGRITEFESRFEVMGAGYRWLSWELRGRSDGTWLAVVHDVDDHARTETRLGVQYAVARVLAESESMAEAEPRILEELCRAEGWQLGALWWVDKKSGVIRCDALWHQEGMATTEIEKASRTTTFRSGNGIPGYVWASGEPLWVPDFALDDQFPRSPMAAVSGLRCACAYPIFIRRGGPDEILGVIELFSGEPRTKSDLNLEMMRHIGLQLGQFARRRRLEDSLVTAEKRLEYVVQHAPVVLLAIEADGRVVLHEGGGLGDVGNLLGRSLFDVFAAGSDATDGHPLVGQVRRALGGEAFEAVVELSPGKTHEVRFAPVFGERGGEKGNVTGVIVVALDISDRMAAEDALRQAQLRLVEADRLVALGTLAAGAAHEINNPLTYLSLNLGRLLTLEQSRQQRDAVSSHRAEIIAEARDGVDRVARIVRDLKTFARVDTREHHGPVDLEAVLDSSIRIAHHEIKHRARLTREHGDIPAVHGDPGRLGQLFLNLLLNAAQSIPEGEAHLNEIHVGTRREPDGRIAVIVRDTGTGVAPEILDRIFDPFFTTKPRVGTGLGLSICRSLATGMSGEITVDSVFGQGATFTVYLQASDQPRPSAREIDVAEADGPRHRGRVLVIDDDRLVVEAVAAALRDEHEVVVSGSGREALGLLQADDDFDAIVCDVMLAEIMGMDVYDALRLTRPSVVDRMVFMTAGAFTPTAQRFLEETHIRCLDKPFNPESLHELVHSLVARRRNAELH